MFPPYLSPFLTLQTRKGEGNKLVNLLVAQWACLYGYGKLAWLANLIRRTCIGQIGIGEPALGVRSWTCGFQLTKLFFYQVDFNPQKDQKEARRKVKEVELSGLNFLNLLRLIKNTYFFRLGKYNPPKIFHLSVLNNFQSSKNPVLSQKINFHRGITQFLENLMSFSSKVGIQWILQIEIEVNPMKPFT